MNNRHCGLVVNYQCNAACRHCLYACSPNRLNDYMTPEATERICNLLKRRGVDSLHIGGGEPFLNFEGLIKVIERVKRAGLIIEYIETNGFWSSDEKQARQYLSDLAKAGADNLLISLDPFHIEYIPVGRPLRLAEICTEVGFRHFLHQKQFIESLSCLEHQKTYSRSELEQQISPTYLLDTAKIYGVTTTGSAINLEEEFVLARPVSELITESHPCNSLLRTDFIHVDLYERYVMAGCTGITIPLVEAVGTIPSGSYPVFEILVMKGVKGLLEFAKKQGYKPEQGGYTSSCALCFRIRNWLSENYSYPELNAEYYEAALMKR